MPVYTCNQMCLLNEWDENKERNCDICPGRKEEMSALDDAIDIYRNIAGKEKANLVIEELSCLRSDKREFYDAIDAYKIELADLRTAMEEHPYHEACPKCYARYQSSIRMTQKLNSKNTELINVIENIKDAVKKHESKRNYIYAWRDLLVSIYKELGMEYDTGDK